MDLPRASVTRERRVIHLRTIEEVAKIRRAAELVARCLRMLAGLVEPGVTTRDLDRAAYAFIRQEGGVATFLGYRGYPASICVSVNDEVVHGIPGDRRLREGDLVGLDCGITVDDYVGDSAVTVGVGSMSDADERLVRVTRESLERGIAAAQAGNRVGDISHAVEQHVEKHGYGVVRDLVGHGIGREMHEEPPVPNYGRPGRGPKLTPGMVIAIEPMVTAGHWEVETLSDGWTVVTSDRSRSAHFEHTVAITPHGPEILSVDGVART